ncbi:MAG: FxsA family protein [Pirellulales bacterium]|nr:FxsA family protein [Pirellulales bacterium]
MRLRLLLLFVFIVVPLVELRLLLWIGVRIGFFYTFMLVIVTGVVGASLARHEGWRCWTTARRRLANGELPTDSLLDGLMILLAGVVLITPGVLTDCLGFALLIRPIRGLFRRWVAERFRAHLVMVPPSGTSWDRQQDKIIDVQVVDASRDERDEP